MDLAKVFTRDQSFIQNYGPLRMRCIVRREVCKALGSPKKKKKKDEGTTLLKATTCKRSISCATCCGHYQIGLRESMQELAYPCMKGCQVCSKFSAKVGRRIGNVL